MSVCVCIPICVRCAQRLLYFVLVILIPQSHITYSGTIHTQIYTNEQEHSGKNKKQEKKKITQTKLRSNIICIYGLVGFWWVWWRMSAQKREKTHKPKHKTITKTENGCFSEHKEHELCKTGRYMKRIM